MSYIDLHTHTTASDGTLSPSQLVHQAKGLGLDAIAITDHDTVDGVKEGFEEGKKTDLEVVAGVEISVSFLKEMHILGYFIDIMNPFLLEKLSLLQKYRSERNIHILERLDSLGFHLTVQDLEEAAQGQVIGRPHLAKVLYQKGYVSSMEEAFTRYLALGKPAYVPKIKLSPEDGISLINKAKGIAVLAHPKNLMEDKESFEKTLKFLKEQGLKGIEAYYTSHSYQEIKYLLAIANKYGLAVSGGTDFHGSNKAKIQLGRGFGNLKIEKSILDKLKNLL